MEAYSKRIEDRGFFDIRRTSVRSPEPRKLGLSVTWQIWELMLVVAVWRMFILDMRFEMQDLRPSLVTPDIGELVVAKRCGFTASLQCGSEFLSRIRHGLVVSHPRYFHTLHIIRI
jgi:hypothetical protein